MYKYVHRSTRFPKRECREGGVLDPALLSWHAAALGSVMKGDKWDVVIGPERPRVDQPQELQAATVKAILRQTKSPGMLKECWVKRPRQLSRYREF